VTHSDSEPPVLTLDTIRTLSPADRILLYLALGTMKMGGHRYGAFLDAATTAAKLAIYTTYQEQGRNLRQTSLLYHVEPKRVKAIVQEVQQALAAGQTLKSLNSKESYYLTALPPLWRDKYPRALQESRVVGHGLTQGECHTIESQLPPDLPSAKVLDQTELNELIQLLHHLSQQALPPAQQMPFSDALLNHIKFRLLHARTVIQIDTPLLNIPLFALGSPSYSPKGEQERVFSMIDDVSRYFALLQAWAREETGVLRGVEIFDIDPEARDQALRELDDLLRAWADKYHQDGGYPMIMQVAAGTREFD